MSITSIYISIAAATIHSASNILYLASKAFSIAFDACSTILS